MSSSPTAAPPSLITTGLTAVSVIFPVLSFIAVILRFRCRRTTGQRILADDWLTAVTWLVSFGLSIDIWVFGSVIGIDHYKPSVDFATGNKASSQCLIIASLITQVDLTTIKIAILYFYMRIFHTPVFRKVVWFSIGLVSAWGIVTFFLIVFQGDPRTVIVEGKQEFNIDPIAVGRLQVVGTLALDVAILCLPLPVIFGLKMATRKKIAVALIFWLGIFCCIAAAVRVALTEQVLAGVIDTLDLVATQATQFVFLLVEPHCSIIAACLPCYAPLLGLSREFFLDTIRSMFTLRSGSRGSSGNRSHRSHRSQRFARTADSESQVHLSNRDQFNQSNVYTKMDDGRPSTRGNGSTRDIPLDEMGAIKVTKNVAITRADG